MDSLENHGAGAKFDAFHAGMEQENCNIIPHESMEYKTMKNHGKHRMHGT